MDVTIIYSFVVPIYNDGRLASTLCAEVESVFRRYLGIADIRPQVEVIFVNDGSRDDSSRRLQEACTQYPFAKYIELSRNFGQHTALSAGYAHASGQYVGSLNVDMEDPPDQIPVLLDHLKAGGYDIVLGVRTARHSPLPVRIGSLLFNWSINKLAGVDLPLQMATLRVMNRRFTDAYTSFTEKYPYLPGLEAWLGFKRGLIEVTHQRRRSGRSSYTFRRRLKMATEAVISMSDVPLRWTVAAGLLLTISGMLVTLGVLGREWSSEVPRLPWLIFGIGASLGGVQLIAIGLAGVYIGRVLREVQNRPRYVIRDKFNF